MGKNIAISEGYIARVFGCIKKLFTRQSGSDDMIEWVPESDRQLTTKYITENGVYRASDDGYYAYSSVTVSVPTTDGVTGEGDDGEQHYVAPDPETGELVDTVLPESIAVTASAHPVYHDGETIDYTGVEVTAYLASGEVWEDENHPGGIIPISELYFPVTVAHLDEGQEIPPDQASSDLDSGFEYPILCGRGKKVLYRTYGNYEDTRITNYYGPKYTFYQVQSSTCLVIAAGDQPGYAVMSTEKILHNTRTGEEEITTEHGQFDISRTYTHDGKTVYYYAWTEGYSGFNLTEISPISEINGTVDTGKAAWTMVYGDIVPGEVTETLPVEWARPKDNVVLSTSFDIALERY